MIKLRVLIDKFSRKNVGENLSLGEILELFKKINNLDPNFFDVDAVRAIDSSKPKRNEDIIYFNNNKKHYIDLCPRLIICLYRKNPVFLRSPKIIFP